MRIRILSAADVTRGLTMDRALGAMRIALGELSRGQAVMPQRPVVDTNHGRTLLMPGYLPASGDFCVKVVSVFDGNPDRGLSRVTGLALALDAETGAPQAVIEAESLTAIRTGAVGGLAAQLLARDDAQTVALFGAGVQARAQLRAVLAVREIRSVNLFSRRKSSAHRFAEEVAGWSDCPVVRLADDPADAVRDADIVIAATTSKTPVFDGADLRPGCHVTGIGSFTPEMQEVDAVTVRRSRVFVDSREAAQSEAGDLIMARATIDGELGEIVNGSLPGRRDREEITFFKSVGVAVQDAAAAGALLREAERLDLGALVSL